MCRKIFLFCFVFENCDGREDSKLQKNCFLPKLLMVLNSLSDTEVQRIKWIAFVAFEISVVWG